MGWIVDLWSIDLWEKISKIVAVILGGAWVFINSIVGRVFVPKLQLECSGKLVSIVGIRHIRVRIQCKNAGIRRVHLDIAAIIICPLRTNGSIEIWKEHKVRELQKSRTVQVLETFSGYDKEKLEITDRPIKTLEPGIAMNQVYLICVPAEYDAFKLELRVVVEEGRFRRWLESNIFWSVVADPTQVPGTNFSATSVVVSDDALKGGRSQKRL